MLKLPLGFNGSLILLYYPETSIREVEVVVCGSLRQAGNVFFSHWTIVALKIPSVVWYLELAKLSVVKIRFSDVALRLSSSISMNGQMNEDPTTATVNGTQHGGWVRMASGEGPYWNWTEDPWWHKALYNCLMLSLLSCQHMTIMELELVRLYQSHATPPHFVWANHFSDYIFGLLRPSIDRCTCVRSCRFFSQPLVLYTELLKPSQVLPLDICYPPWLGV